MKEIRFVQRIPKEGECLVFDGTDVVVLGIDSLCATALIPPGVIRGTAVFDAHFATMRIRLPDGSISRTPAISLQEEIPA